MIKRKKSFMARIIDFFKNLKEKVKRMLQPKEPKVEVSPIKEEVSEPEEDLEDKIEEEEKLEQERKKEAEKNKDAMKEEAEVEKKINEIDKEKDKKIVGVGESDKEIEKEIEEMGNETFYFTNWNWRVFYRFINATEKKLDIITNRMSSKTFKFLFNKLSSTVKTRVIVGHTPRNYDNIKQFKTERGLDVELYVCRRVHCKFCIRDDINILLGSSNMVFTSLGNLQRRGNFEADIISEDVFVVKEASNLFETIWQEKKKYKPIYPDCQFLSSVSGIPSKIVELISKTEKELIIFSPNFADKELICAVRMLNKNIKIKIVLNWPNKASEKVKKALNLIRDGKTTDGSRLFLIRPKRQQIHAKIYVFDRKTALISSLNLTQSSWGYMIETGLFTYDKETIENITKMIEIFYYKIPSSIEIRGDGGDGELPEITEIPDEKYLFLDPEGKKFLKKCGPLIDKFRKEFGEEFPESIPEEIEEDETPPVKEVTEKQEEDETPPVKEVTEKQEEVETPPPFPEKLRDLAIKQKTAVVIDGNRKWRLGKGFSNEEIKRAIVGRVYRSLYTTDKIRKTCHEHNIQIIRKIIKLYFHKNT